MPLPRESLVSLWSDRRDVGAESFVCSGVFVDQKRVLTVKHPFKGDRQLWVRPWASALKAYEIVASHPHDSLDATILQIEEMPRDCAPAMLDHRCTEKQLSQALTLNGYFRGLYEPPTPTRHLGYDPERHHHLIDVRQPPGYSGCGVAHGNGLWGIAFAHYTDPAVVRGCAVSLGQLWSWLQPLLEDPLFPAGSAASSPQDPVARRQDIIALILQNTMDSLDQAKNRTMDLVKDSYPSPQDEDEVTLLSFDLRVIAGMPNNAARRRETKKLVASLLSVTHRAIERIVRRLEKGSP